MPDRTVTSLRRAVAVAAVAALAAGCGACSSGKPDDTWKAENAYGTEMAKKGFWREALFRYEKAAAQKPGDAQVQNNLAVAYESTGDTARALAAYKRALELAPQDAKIKRNYARFAEYYTSVQRSSSLPAPSSSAPEATAPAPAPVRRSGPGRGPVADPRAPAARRPPRLRRRCPPPSRPEEACDPPRRRRPPSPRRSSSGPARSSNEVKLKLPLRPKLAVTGRERITLAPFIVASRLSDKKDAPKYKDLDLDAEFRRYLGKQLGKRTKMTVVTMPADVRLPTTHLKELTEAGGLLEGPRRAHRRRHHPVRRRRLPRREQVRLPLRGVHQPDRRPEVLPAGPRRVDGLLLRRHRPRDGRAHGRAALPGELPRHEGEEPKRAVDELAGLFENLFSLENQLLGLFVVREREANRYVFD